MATEARCAARSPKCRRGHGVWAWEAPAARMQHMGVAAQRRPGPRCTAHRHAVSGRALPSENGSEFCGKRPDSGPKRKKKQKWRRSHDAHGNLLKNGARNDHGARKATLAGTPHLGVAVRIGQAFGELPRTLPLVDGCSPVRIVIIGVRNRSVGAHFRRRRHLGNGCELGAQIGGVLLEVRRPFHDRRGVGPFTIGGASALSR